MTAINRRRALSGSAAVAVGVPLLAACGDDSGSTAADPSASTSETPGEASPSEDGAASGSEALASVGDVPVGGCFVVAASKIVVTQASEGDFKAFSAVCTHQGCLVETSSEGDIPCPCHGSTFSLEDGSALSGPASEGLAPVIVDELAVVLVRFYEAGTSLLLIEQNYGLVRRVATHYHVLSKGSIVEEGELAGLSMESLKRHVSV